MMNINFHDSVDDCLLEFAVIIPKHKGQWVLCKHKDRNTYEFPGGHRENGEKIDDTAKRELWEETGAVEYHMKPVCVYSVAEDKNETFGMLYCANIDKFEKLPAFEIEKIEFFRGLPEEWTYPLIQPKLLRKVKKLFEVNK